MVCVMWCQRKAQAAEPGGGGSPDDRASAAGRDSRFRRPVGIHMAGEEDSNGFLEQTLEALRQKECADACLTNMHR